MTHTTNDHILHDAYAFLKQELTHSVIHKLDSYGQWIDDIRTNLDAFVASYPYRVFVSDCEAAYDKDEQILKPEVWDWLDQNDLHPAFFDEMAALEFACPIFGFTDEMAAAKFKCWWG